jgi:hypothetical protein
MARVRNYSISTVSAFFLASFCSPWSPAMDPRDAAWPPTRTRQSARRGTRALALQLQRHAKRRPNAIYGNVWTSPRHTSTRAHEHAEPSGPRRPVWFVAPFCSSSFWTHPELLLRIVSNELGLPVPEPPPTRKL